MYSIIIEQYPHYTHGKKNAAQACFYLIDPNSNEDLYFKLGLYFLSGKSYKKSDLIDLDRCLPGKYKEKFKQQIV